MAPTQPEAKAASPPRGKKRSSSVFSSCDENKKARGRPRVEPQDQTAADRRRTQIRLAQRSYRQRKEGTITELQTKVSKLESLVTEMNDSFQDINRNALTTSLCNANLHLSRQISNAASRFQDLSQNLKYPKFGLQGSSDDSLSDPPEHSQSPASKSVEKPVLITSKKSPTSKNIKHSPPTIVSTVERGVPSVWGYETIYDTPPDDSDHQRMSTNITVENVPQQPAHPAFESSQPSTFNSTWQALGPLTPFDNTYFNFSFGAGSEMPSPISYAALEDTFERRLHRTIIEAGVRLLSARNPPVARVRAVFGHVMKYYSQLELRDHFVECLNRGPGEPLDSRAVYPYAGPYTQQYWYIESPDGQAREEMFNAEDNKGDGAWFLAGDVQRYLEAKGINIPRGALYVNWEYETIHPRYPPWPSPASSTDGEQSDPMNNASLELLNPQASFQHFDPGPPVDANMLASNTTKWTAHVGASPPDMSGSVPPPAMNAPAGAGIQQRPQMQRVPHKFTIDVTQLVADLQFATVCLGKCPGFRRRDVEAAFNNCLVPAAG